MLMPANLDLAIIVAPAPLKTRKLPLATVDASQEKEEIQYVHTASKGL